MNKYLVFLLIILLIVLIYTIYKKLNKKIDKFENISENNKILIVLYYANWCPHCKPVKEFFDTLINNSPDPNFIFKKKENDEIEKETPELFNKIVGFPTIIIYKNNQEIVYSGKRDKESLIKYLYSLNNKVESNVESKIESKAINNTTSDQIINIILYYANWCSHCKPVKEFFDTLIDNSPNPKYNFSKIEHDEIVKKSPELFNKIVGFPTIIIYLDQKEIIYDGERNKQSLLEFLNNL